MPYQVDLFEPPPPPPPPKYDFGENCPIPGYFPTLGGEPQNAWTLTELIKKKDWRSLQYNKAKWYCHFCRSWHHFDKFFFDMFDGVYTHEMCEQPDHEWHLRFGGWEARFRRDFGLVGRSILEVFREVTHAVYYAYWANGGDVEFQESSRSRSGTPEVYSGEEVRPEDSVVEADRANGGTGSNLDMVS